jgi:pilus assembly protein Flp/PilA
MLDPLIHFFLMTQIRVKDITTKPRNDEGATAVEYGLMVALIAGVIVVAVAALGTKLNTIFTSVTAAMP